MKPIFFQLISIFLLLACRKEAQKPAAGWVEISQKVRYKQDSKGLDLQSGKFQNHFETTKLPLKKVMVLNASLIGYISELGAEQKMIAVSSPEYIYSDKVLKLIQTKKIADIGNEQKYDVEKIIAMKPDAIFTNHIESFQNTYELLKKNGIQIIFLNEYEEQNPLEKAAYIRVFGKLLDMEKKGDSIYNSIQKNYNALSSSVKNEKSKPKVICNEMYGGQWFLPGGRTFAAKYFQDAGADYILKDNTDAKAIPMGFEEVFVKSNDAKYWVNIGPHQSKKQMLAINPNYEKLQVYKTGKLYTLTGRARDKANDYFESGVVRADLVLKDYIKIFHPEKLPNYKPFYMKELK